MGSPRAVEILIFETKKRLVCSTGVQFISEPKYLLNRMHACWPAAAAAAARRPRGRHHRAPGAARPAPGGHPVAAPLLW